MKRILKSGVAFLLCCSGYLGSAFTNEARSQFKEQDSTYKNKYLILPAISVSPETSLMLGGVLIWQFKPQKAGWDTRSSNLLISAIYTLKNQILCSFVPEVILPEERWIFTGNHFLVYFPEKFWGVGSNTQNSDELSVLYTQLNIEQSFLKKIKRDVYLGSQFRWSGLSGVRFKDSGGNPVSSPDVRGNRGATSAGLGFVARWDTRNSILNPTKDFYIDLSVLFNPSFFGSTYSYSSVQLDARKYFDLHQNESTIIAFQTISRLTSGSPSFRDLSLIGGDVIMRGYYEGRFRDNNAAQIQTELRRRLIGRFGFTLFSAVGNVWRKFNDLSLKETKWTSGIGLRFDLNPRDTNNLRLDFGIGPHTSGFYLMFGEAF